MLWREMFACSARTLACICGHSAPQHTDTALGRSASAQPEPQTTLQVIRPVLPHGPQNSLTGSEEVAIVIGLFPCSGADGQPASCAETNTTGVLGTILYNGPYEPQYADGAPSLPPHQNFSIQVPATFKSGQVSLGVAHFALVGVRAACFVGNC